MIKILFLCLLLQASFAQVLTTVSPATALPIGFSMPSEVTNLVQSKGTSSPVCRSVWSKDDTLCDANGLINFDTSRNQLITADVTQLKLIVAKSLNMGIVQSQSARRLLGSSFISASNWNPYASKTPEVQKCWDFLIKTREAALCYACSKQNSNYFTSQKALLSKDDCDSMLLNCGDFFRVTLAKILAVNPKSIKSAATKQNLLAFRAYVEKSQLATLFVQWDIPEKTKSAASSLCARLYTIYKEPLFKLFLDMETAIQNDKNSKGRLLQSDPLASSLSTNPFEGDVAISQGSNNMFEAFDGAKGTPQHVQNTHYQQMNLSLQFA